MSPLLSLRPMLVMSSMWRQVKPRLEPDRGARALVDAMVAGQQLGEALTQVGPLLAKVAVSEAGKRFESGPVALFIVDVRDSLKLQLRLAGRLSQDVTLRMALERAARKVDDDTFVQHLINAILEATGVYTESMPLDRLDEGACEASVSKLFTRALSLLVSRHDGARRLGQRSTAIEFPSVPAPSAPRF